MKKKLIILGGGVSGKAAERLGNILGYNCRIINDNDTETLPESDLIVASPGVHPLKSNLYRQAVAEGRAMIGELAFGSSHITVPQLAITGTNGKTTTTELTTHLLNTLGVKAVSCGNIGNPVSDIAADILSGKGEMPDAAVLEVSSFQLELAENFAPAAAVLLNLKSDHEERYPNGFEEYCEVKKRIFDMVPEDKRFYGVNSFDVRGVVHYRGDALMYGNKTLIEDVSQTPFSASHNRENLAAAAELTLTIIPFEKLDTDKFISGVNSFKFGRHRIEFVLQKDGIRYYNDSKATNPSAVTSAVNALKGEGKIVLMLGGSDKGMDFSELNELDQYLRGVVLYGAAGETIGKELTGDVPRKYAGMDFARAVKMAKELAEYGDIVLLSPACASFDMFKSYADRGDQFCRLVQEL